MPEKCRRKLPRGRAAPRKTNPGRRLDGGLFNRRPTGAWGSISRHDADVAMRRDDVSRALKQKLASQVRTLKHCFQQSRARRGASLPSMPRERPWQGSRCAACRWRGSRCRSDPSRPSAGPAFRAAGFLTMQDSWLHRSTGTPPADLAASFAIVARGRPPPVWKYTSNKLGLPALSGAPRLGGVEYRRTAGNGIASRFGSGPARGPAQAERGFELSSS